MKLPKIFSLLALVVLTGCGILPLAPGRSSFVSATTQGQLVQSQNPKQESKQIYKRTDGAVTETVETVIGAAQRDTAREVAAKLGALKGVVWVGILVFLFGAASAVWPPLKVLVGGSLTTSAVIAAAGLALIVLPSLLIGHELLILCVALGVAAAYFFAHRHASVHSKLKTLTEPSATVITK